MTKNVIKPKYEKDETLNIFREVDAPPEALFIGLGWDEDDQTNRKHYRRFFPKELEKIKAIFPKDSPFNTYPIVRGQSRGIKASFWSVLTNKVKQD